MLKYKNPVILQDFSDPDVIRVGNDFYMVASSFNYMPGLPVLHSKNLVNWRLINYVYDAFPLPKYNEVRRGHGAWAPSIRYHDGIFYVMIPTPDEGLFVSETKDPYGKWSPLRLVVPGVGLEDPCPIWLNGKCYVVHGYVKSRCGFNSKLGIIECDEKLTTKLTESTVIYDGHNDNPTIEGPKFNYRNGYFYIMAPAGGVKTGWQTALRSKNIYGPYETKIVLAQGHTEINGPHQGALIEIDDNDNWAFIHFVDQECYGRVTYLENVMWHNDWPIIGHVTDPLLFGEPVAENEYIINKESNYKIPLSDNFKKKLNLSFQTPANKAPLDYYVDNGLYLRLKYNDIKDLKDLPHMLSEKVGFYNFNVDVKLDLTNLNINEEAGFTYLGLEYYGLIVRKVEDNYKILLVKGGSKTADEIIEEVDYNSNIVNLKMKFRYPGYYQLGINNQYFKTKFKATKGDWVGGRLGLFARGYTNNYVLFKYFKVRGLDAK